MRILSFLLYKRFLNSVALIKIPLLPFALSLETWRWQVMDGRIKPRNYNQAWWDLKMKFQGNTLNPFRVSSLLFNKVQLLITFKYRRNKTSN